MSNTGNIKTSTVKGLLSVNDYIVKYNVINRRGHLVTPQTVFNWIYRWETKKAKKPKPPPFEYIKDAGGIWIKD